MYNTIEINGKEYPVSFGINALSDFSRRAGLTLAQLTKFDGMDMEHLKQLFYCSLKDGHRKAVKSGELQSSFEMTAEDVADLLDEDRPAMGRLMRLFQESQAPAEGNAVKGKPKKAAPK